MPSMHPSGPAQCTQTTGTQKRTDHRIDREHGRNVFWIYVDTKKACTVLCAFCFCYCKVDGMGTCVRSHRKVMCCTVLLPAIFNIQLYARPNLLVVHWFIGLIRLSNSASHLCHIAFVPSMEMRTETHASGTGSQCGSRKVPAPIKISYPAP